MVSDEEAKLIERLRKVERLAASTTFEGERVAAEAAAAGLRERLQSIKPPELEIPYRFSLSDQWERSLLVQLLRKHRLAPYRRSGQRRTTVMVDAPRSLIENVVWPKYQAASHELHRHFDAVANRVIAAALGGDGSDVSEKP